MGPLHGGANEDVIRTLSGSWRTAATSRSGWTAPRTRITSSSSWLRASGLQELRPRATIIKRAAERVLDATGADGELFEVAKKLEEVAIHDDYFVQRKLYANVDFYPA